MKKIAFALAVAMAACSQPAPAPEAEAPPAPATPFEQVQAMAPEQQLVYAFQAVAQGGLTPPCQSVRGTESRGIVPENVAADSIYAPYVGALALSVQCGPQLTTVGNDPKEHWLVLIKPGAPAAEVISCANAEGRDICYKPIPTATAP